MRAFIAVDISDELKSLLGRVEAHLLYAGADVKWLKPESIHMTMKFLGEITEKQKEDVSSALDAIAISAKTFDVSLKYIGAFPGIERARVIWVGLGKGAAESVGLAARVDESLSMLGFTKEERSFSPHLTIGRVRSSRNISKLAEKIPGAAGDIVASAHISHQVNSLVLFQSTLTPCGSIYTKLHESHFGS